MAVLLYNEAMDTISFDEFQRADLRVVQILSAERVEGSDKLLKLSVDSGEKSEAGEVLPRQVIAGIGKVYEPEALIGKQIAIIANLEPRMIMGLESRGMILAAPAGEGLALLSPTAPTPNGSKLR